RRARGRRTAPSVSRRARRSHPGSAPLRRSALSPHLRRRRSLDPSFALRAVRSRPNDRHALRLRSGRARHWRTLRYRARYRPPRSPDRLPLPGGIGAIGGVWTSSRARYFPEARTIHHSPKKWNDRGLFVAARGVHVCAPLSGANAMKTVAVILAGGEGSR